MPATPFHAGELALQQAAGARERMATIGPKVIRDFMPEQHRELFQKLPTMFVGTLAPDGQPWATVVVGPPGFVQAPDERTLHLATAPGAEDPARHGLFAGAAVGLLGLEPHTRRRNRANGVIEALDDQTGAWTVRVHQSFGNCPKYIHRREPIARPSPVAAPALRETSRLSVASRELIERCDTLFLASSSAGRVDRGELTAQPGAGVDVSHRGGEAGFVSVMHGPDGDELAIADYPGNTMFNTLGNLLAWPRAGLLFLDWRDGHVLQLAASARLDPDTRRLHLSIIGGVLRPFAVPLTWTSAP